MKYLMKGVPEHKVMKKVLFYQEGIEVHFLMGGYEFYSNKEYEKIKALYEKQIKLFLSHGYNHKLSLVFRLVPLTAFAVTILLSLFFDLNVGLFSGGLIIGVGILAGMKQELDFKESQEKYNLVQNQISSFYSKYEEIKKLLGDDKRMHQKEDIIFVVDDLPKQLLLNIDKF